MTKGGGLPKLFNTISRSMSSSGASNSSRSRPYTVIVEGNIGAGKTTFLQPFKKHENIVQVVTEPVDKWRNLQGHNLLQKMYDDPKRWSFELQSYIQLTMAQEHMKPCHVPIKMMERSLLRFLLYIKVYIYHIFAISYLVHKKSTFDKIFFIYFNL